MNSSHRKGWCVGLMVIFVPLFLSCGFSPITTYGVAVDGRDNIILTGMFHKDASFGSTRLTSHGGTDLFVGKMDSRGKWLWVKAAGSLGEEVARAVAVDRQDNIIVVGTFGDGWVGTMIEFGGASLTTQGHSNLFVAKLDSNGKWLWATQAVGSSMPFGVAVDGQNNIIITGNFSDTTDFGGTKLKSEGENDIFVAKLDNNGKWLWASRAGSTKYDLGAGVTSDPQGNIVITGQFGGTIWFGGTRLITQGENDLFVARLDSHGKWLWASRAGSRSYNDTGANVAIDKQGNVLLVGTIGSTSDSVGATRATEQNSDIFVAKLDSNGKWLWQKSAGGAGYDNGIDVKVDGQNGVLIAGNFGDLFGGTVTFGDTTLTSAGKADMFVAKLDSNGTWLWAKRAGTTAYDDSFGMALDGQGFVITGISRGRADGGWTSGDPGEFANEFLWKLKPSP